MAKQKTRELTASFLQPPTANIESVNDQKPVAMTLKLPHEVYIRLRALAAAKKSKGQTIMLQAVTEYLDRVGG